MSVKKEIYSLLASNEELNTMLARSAIAGGETWPAIYDSWPPDNSPMPYIITTYAFPEGKHWAQVDGAVTIDIFNDNRDSIGAEDIKNKLLEILAWQKIRTEEEGIISIYFGGTDTEIPEPEPDVIHWQVNFRVKYWRQKLIAAITNN